MPRPNRRDVVDPEEVGIYHCYSRCARGAYLCGFDRATNTDYSHRKAWLIERQNLLASVFAMELLAFAILDNHMHHVVRTRPDLVGEWSDEEVIRRWCVLHPLRAENGEVLEMTESHLKAMLQDKETTRQWRERLGSLSWYMKELKEPIAKRANRESGQTGSFFDSRFNSPRLADALTLLICLLYVELNAVRAAIVDRPEDYDACSFRARTQAHQLRTSPVENQCNVEENRPDAALQPIPERGESGNETAPYYRPSNRGILEMTASHYIALVDWVGRTERPDKRGKIPGHFEPILERIGGSAELMTESYALYEQIYRRAGRRVDLSNSG